MPELWSWLQHGRFHSFVFDSNYTMLGGHLSQESVQVGVGGPADVQVSVTDVVHGLVVHDEAAVLDLQRAMRAEHRVVRLHDHRRYLVKGLTVATCLNIFGPKFKIRK